jgi:HD-GYP domain-containing protein (c-di-GMP phosphodiesterase class II)
MLSKEKIISEIETNKGKQFDPLIADVMLRLIQQGKIVMED